MAFDMTRTDKQRKRLIGLLEELFQLDQPDLDFGFYRIMHAKAASVSDFLQNDLLKIIQDTFGKADEEKIERARLQYEQAIEQAKLFSAPDPEAAKPVQTTKAAYDAAKDSGANEGEIYEHLYRFFERYYDNGDFMSRRYFAGETGGKAAPYAVPYDGREVYLHWANRDQYYIKTSEYLTNCTFDIAHHFAHHFTKAQRVTYNMPDNLKLHCRIVDAAEGEHNNNKTTDKTERFFLIYSDQPTVMDNGELVLQFEYRPDKEKSGTAAKWQEKRIDEAESAILHALTGIGEAENYNIALRTEIGEDTVNKKSNRTLLRKYLNQYTKRNTTDYFIHKDLGSFLKRELDFYIKNEIMRLDDIENADASQVESYLDKIKVLRKIAGQLIAFLAQLEDFQKKLWLKKKFVTETQYCITLDRIPEDMYAEIAANDAQRKEWVALFAIDEIQGDLTTPAYSEPLGVDFLKANPFLVLDTAFFSRDFKDALIAGVQDLDKNLDGLLIHSENFQALGLMQEKYKEQVKCTHIDPPYNTQTSGFAYKNGYKHSSWLSMMANRFVNAISLLNDSGSVQCHIDENEYEYLHILLEQFQLSDAGTVVWDKRNPMNGGNGVATQHEYIAWKTKEAGSLYNRNKSILSILSKAKELIEFEGGVTEKVRNDFTNWVNKNNSLTGGEKAYRYIDEEGRVYRGVSLRAPEPRVDRKFHQPIIHPKTNKPCAMPPNGFSRTPETLQEMIKSGDILFGSDEYTQPQQKMYLTEDRRRQFSSVMQNAKKGKADTSPMKIDFPYCHPVSLYEDMISAVSHQSNEIILDYFAGSGTTGHAVVNLNREDDGKRKYIMVEMGDYFDAVTKPRMQKVVYSQDWKDGKPVSRDGQFNGISHAFKYIRLESYEDTLNNLSFREDDQAKARQKAINHPDNKDFKREYMLKYWLEFETKGSPSLLNIEQFDDPAAYRLTLKKPGSDEYEEKTVDLVESFNWLIGLHVDHLDRWRSYSASSKREPDPELPGDDATRLILNTRMEETEGGKWLFRKIEGRVCRTPGDMDNTDRVLVIWRKLTGNLEEDNVMLDEYFKKVYPKPEDRNFDIIYINGSNNLQQLCTDEEQWQVRLTEQAFHQKMWDEEG